MILKEQKIKIVENIEIQVSSFEEQKIIAGVLKEITTKEQSARELAQSALDKVDVMKKSIFAKAFRGKLGTNNPEEESSIELLKQILDKTN